MTDAFYANAFLTKQPKEGISVVQARLKDAITLDTEFADYVKERAQIEEAYAKSLSKASKKLYTTDPGILGHFGPVWEQLLNELNQVASFHSELAHRIIQEIEKPMRTMPFEEYDRLQQMEPMIQSLNKSKRNSIFKKKPTENGNWQTNGVEYLNLHQKIDECRLTRLKSMVEAFEVLQSDQLKKRIEMANITLLSAQKFDVNHDIQDFCTERARDLQTVPHRPRSSTVNSHDSFRSTNKFKSVFAKRKKSHEQFNDMDNHLPRASQHQMSNCSSVTEEPVPDPVINISPVASNVVDSEGYSIPPSRDKFAATFGSDISSRNSPSDIDSDLQSWNQRLQVNIRDNVLHEETDQANASFNKMANMLRERTPTVTRRPRGRRESNIPRSQTHSVLISAELAPNVPDRANSMILVSETNPFITSSSMALSNFNTVSTPSLHHSPTITTRNSETSLQLAPIPETQQPLSVSIVEKTRVTGSNMYIAGQVLITCHSNTGSIPIQLNGLDHIQNLRPRSPYVIVQADGYVINTSHFEPGKPVACFMFDVNTDTSQLPLQLVAFWKCVDGISYLIVKHSKNIDIDPSKIKGSVSVAMEDQVNNVQSTPQGVWDTVKNRLTWQISDLMQQYQPDSSQQRLLAKFYIEGKGSSQPIYFNYCLEDNTLPNISIQSDAVEIKQSIVQSNQVVYM